MQHNLFEKHLGQANRSLISILCCFLTITAVWLGVYVDNNFVALAKPREAGIVEKFDGAIASQPAVMNDLKNRVKDDLTRKSDSGTGDFLDSAAPIEGEARSSGMSQSELHYDKPAGQVEGTNNPVSRWSEENVAKVQGEDTNSEGRIEDAVEDVTSNIKSMIN